MRIEKVPKGEFKRKYGPRQLGDHSVTEEGEHVIIVPEGDLLYLRDTMRM